MKGEGKTINKGADKTRKEVFSRNFMQQEFLNFYWTSMKMSGKFLKKCILPAVKRL